MDQNVLQFQVTANNFIIMDLEKTIYYLLQEDQRFRLRKVVQSHLLV